MAARYGAETVKVIESHSSSRGHGSESSMGVKVPPIGAKSLGRYQHSTTKGQETERQTTVQSMFADFLRWEAAHGSLAWNALDVDGQRKVPAQLSRGDLIQVSVQLSADPAYRLAAFIGEYSAMAETIPELGPEGPPIVAALSGLLDRFMVGQIPVKALVNGVTADASGECLKVEDHRADGPVYLVAATDADQYWTDTRRVLFGGQEFRVLARVVRSAPQDEWSPVRLFDMMKDFLPDLQDKFEDLERLFDHPMASVSEIGVEDAVATSLREYGKALGVEADAPAFATFVDNVAGTAAPSLPSATILSGAFDEIDAWAQAEVTEAPVGSAQLRRDALSAASLTVRGERESVSPAVVDHQQGLKRRERFIEVEIIAIYW